MREVAGRWRQVRKQCIGNFISGSPSEPRPPTGVTRLNGSRAWRLAAHPRRGLALRRDNREERRQGRREEEEEEG